MFLLAHQAAVNMHMMTACTPPSRADNHWHIGFGQSQCANGCVFYRQLQKRNSFLVFGIVLAVGLRGYIIANSPRKWRNAHKDSMQTP